MTQQPDSQKTFKRVVILGASGFIGMNLAQALCNTGVRPVCVSRHSRDDWPDGCQPMICDIANPPMALLNELEGALIYHLASTTKPSQETGHASSELVDNAAATINLLEKTKSYECRWIFVSSGGTVYGQSVSNPIDEDHPCSPISSYGVAKLAIEKYFHLYGALHGVDYVVARVSNPYGPLQSASTGQGLVAVLFARIAGSTALEVWGDGNNIRDYIYVEDAVSALQLLAERGISGSTYNIGYGTGVSINELIDMISKLVGTKAEIRYKPARSIDVRTNVLDISKVRRELGWHPKVDIESGLRRTQRWLDTQRESDAPNSGARTEGAE